MLKSTILLTLALAATSVNAVLIDFWSDMYKSGQKVTCTKLIYDECYRLPDDVVNLGLSSAQYINTEMYTNTFAITLYSGTGCNGRMDRWGFGRNTWEGPYSIEYFQSLNDNVRSFKIANRDLPTTSGAAQSEEEEWVRKPSCRIK
jgi:hypothetical protein